VLSVMLCVLAAATVALNRTPAPVALEAIKDLDAPNALDEQILAKTHNAYAAKLQELTQQPSRKRASPLVQQNRKLKSEVHTLEGEVMSLSKAMRATLAGKHQAKAKAPVQALHGMPKRMAWAKQALLGMHKHKAIRTQSLEGARGLSHELPQESVYYATSRDDPISTESLSTEAGDDNWIAKLAPGDYWKDPYNRPFLHAPNPHDPTSTLAHTVTGDYASPATWGELYKNKENIDWCTENFGWFEDRIKCITTMHSEGPLLG